MDKKRQKYFMDPKQRIETELKTLAGRIAYQELNTENEEENLIKINRA